MDILFNGQEKKYKITFNDDYVIEVESPDPQTAVVEAKLIYRMKHNNHPPSFIKEIKDMREGTVLHNNNTRMLFD